MNLNFHEIIPNTIIIPLIKRCEIFVECRQKLCKHIKKCDLIKATGQAKKGKSPWHEEKGCVLGGEGESLSLSHLTNNEQQPIEYFKTPSTQPSVFFTLEETAGRIQGCGAGRLLMDGWLVGCCGWQ